jgi:methionine sulfoxide reductase catalytic subunit
MSYVLDLVKPKPEARYVVFYLFAEGSDGGCYYDVHEIQNMRHHLTIPAYEMNGAPYPLISCSACLMASQRGTPRAMTL